MPLWRDHARPLARRAHAATNALHSLIYFVPYTEDNPPAPGRGPVGRALRWWCGPDGRGQRRVVTATFTTSARAWSCALSRGHGTSPARAAIISARFAAVDGGTDRLLGPDIIAASRDLATMAALTPGGRGGPAIRRGAPATPVTPAWDCSACPAPGDVVLPCPCSCEHSVVTDLLPRRSPRATVWPGGPGLPHGHRPGVRHRVRPGQPGAGAPEAVEGRRGGAGHPPPAERRGRPDRGGEEAAPEVEDETDRLAAAPGSTWASSAPRRRSASGKP